jgi:hypothetical protein
MENICWNKAAAELTALPTNEAKYEYLQTLFNRKYLYSLFYHNMLVWFIRNNFDREFILYIKDREALIQNSDVLNEAFTTEHVDLVKFLFDSHILRIKYFEIDQFFKSLDLVKYLYKNKLATFNPIFNCYELLFHKDCTKEKFDELYTWLSSVEYKSDADISVNRIDDEVIKFCVEKDIKIDNNSLNSCIMKDRSIIEMLNKYGYTYEKTALVCTFASMNPAEKRQFILDGHISIRVACNVLLSRNLVDDFRTLYPQFKDKFDANKDFIFSILRTANIDFMRIVAAHGKTFSYADGELEYYRHRIFAEKTHNFELWESFHEENLVRWSEEELYELYDAPDYRFIKYAMQNCPDDIKKKFLSSL